MRSGVAPSQASHLQDFSLQQENDKRIQFGKHLPKRAAASRYQKKRDLY